MAHTGEQTIKKQLIHALTNAGDDYISGQYLADIAGCSRTAVWKHIDALRKEGYEIEAIKKKGYRILPRKNRLTETEILMGLETEFIGRSIHAYETVPTTQTIASDLAAKGADNGTIVISEEQTEGKGRLRRTWYSPHQGGIWMSLIVKPDIPPYHAPRLTLLTAVAAVLAIRETGVNAGIKWPNDVLVNGRKIAGILTEMHAEADQIHSVIIGIGINVNQERQDFNEDIQSLATSLAIEKGEMLDRALFLQRFLSRFEQLYLLFLEKGFLPIKELWETYSVTIGQRVTVATAQSSFTGLASGINEDGILMVKDEQTGVQRLVYSGDITIHHM
ncbi:biotin--[acetyl-CoA-carboxylase] ligase [Gracilibacillus sp. Marseille-QA3620]